MTDRQNCGNLLAGVGPFALERGLVAPTPSAGGAAAPDDPQSTEIRIRMVNTDGIATATVPLRDGRPRYDGTAAISGVPGTAAPIRLDFEGVAGLRGQRDKVARAYRRFREMSPGKVPEPLRRAVSRALELARERARTLPS